MLGITIGLRTRPDRPQYPDLSSDLGCENLDLPPRTLQIAVIAVDRRYSYATTAILSDNDDLISGLHHQPSGTPVQPV